MTSRKYPLPEDERLSERIKIRVTKNEKEAIRRTADNMDFEGNMSEFIRALIMDIVEVEGKGVEALMAIGQVSTAGAQRVKDIDFVPEVSILNAETGDPVWVSEPAEVE